MINRIWLALFVVAAASAGWQAVAQGNPQVFTAMADALFGMARLAVDLMIVLFGTLTLWLGLLHIAEQAGLIERVARLLAPLFDRLLPGVPAGHPALGLITMNVAANAIGLDNAATPMGLRAMRELQSLNPEPQRATKAQILFMVMNSSSLTLLPVSILAIRMQQGAHQPADVFAPILLATAASTLAGLASVILIQRIRWRDPMLLGLLAGAAAVTALMVTALASLPPAALGTISGNIGSALLTGVVIGIVVLGAAQGVPVWDAFVTGGRQGFEMARDLLPPLVGMLCAIGVLRASGALDVALELLRPVVLGLGGDGRILDALPTAIAKPFSGSAARALMIETMQTHGVDSFQARLAATIQGSTETTFYVIAVYFGSVGIRRSGHAVPCALFADLIGVLASIVVCHWFFASS